MKKKPGPKMRNRASAPRRSAAGDVLNRKGAIAALRESEIRYRRLFEAAQDGILILDAESSRITDVNPFLVRLLGLRRNGVLGRKLWEIGLFQDVEKSKSAFRELQRNGYIRYEDLPLETKDGRYIDVEFVSNIYKAGGKSVIQCNIRDITERKHAEVEKAILETIEDEQRRIGQDLHDGLCQQLAGVALIAKALAQKLSSVAPEESAGVAEIAELVSRAVDQTRDLARGLSPVEIEVGGLAPALQEFARTTSKLFKVACEFSCTENRFLKRRAPLVSSHLYRIAQEAVNNAIQHGKAGQVKILLTAIERRGLLTIRDNGVGFNVKDEETKGLGLRSMRYRCRIIGARLNISQDPGGGTVVACSFPILDESDGAHHEKRN
jgi:PAS domain S-box-containing protein